MLKYVLGENNIWAKNIVDHKSKLPATIQLFILNIYLKISEM